MPEYKKVHFGGSKLQKIIRHTELVKQFITLSETIELSNKFFQKWLNHRCVFTDIKMTRGSKIESVFVFPTCIFNKHMPH